jgi:SAM-dependent methyltransferase
VIKRILYRLTHNIIVNNLVIWLKLENRIKSVEKVWRSLLYNNGKSLQENVGFSHRKDVEESIAKVHEDLQRHVKSEKTVHCILDVGCGTGLYLKDFEGIDAELFGIDLSPDLLRAAAIHLPSATFIHGSYLSVRLPVKMDIIFSISVLEYISRSDLRKFFSKMHDDLNRNGTIFIHYPHALSFRDTLYPDLNYIKYAPEVIERAALPFYNIIRHSHGFHNSKRVKRYDKEPLSINGGSFLNGYLLIGRKLN